MNPTTSDNKWHVVYTMPNFEKKLSRLFLKKGIECFLPTQQVIKQWSDRKRMIEVPVFPNYLFVKIEKSLKYHVLSTKGVVRFIEYQNEMASIPAEKMKDLKVLYDKDIEVIETSFTEGDEVVVNSGPLVGIHGNLVRWNSKYKLAIRMEILNKSILVDVSPEAVSRVLNVA
ncbi:UpxY family transcription antiterminator [Fulvivirga maritima]|uniref:UpxY family transcription antiterminator n=1 Tax=Fulvivirga maritima TaxID=2904247 RepID=UPI001F3F67C0|nr:UpxY family transcription antiterminator [Fulvivirga maritima]UII27577.1 UpxY family transcription antiterminator [Fulvivirga maritima]